MLRKLFVVGLLCIFALNLAAADMARDAVADEDAGYALLESLVLVFADMAEKGTGGYEKVNNAAQNLMADLKKAKDQEKVDSVFYARYHRILLIIKLTIIDKPYDPEGILDPFIAAQLNEFIDDVTGIEATLQPQEKRGIGAVAGAIAEEVLNLHIYLDGSKDKDELIKKYQFWLKQKKSEEKK
jgi:hypothetical protein